jgi:hypothetical protein
MKTRNFTNPDHAIEFIHSLQQDNTIDVVKLTDETFDVMWVENKKYTTHDGKEFIDEVWTKEDGTMIVCQDLELEHAKNIIRMILRKQRENMIIEAALHESIKSALDSNTPSEDDVENYHMLVDVTDEEVRVLH